MEDKYQLIIVVVLGVLVLQFLLTRYYVSSTVEQTVDSIMDEKVKKINKRLMRSMNSSFEKYMGPSNDSRYESAGLVGHTGPRHGHVYGSTRGYNDNDTEQDVRHDSRHDTRHDLRHDTRHDSRNNHDVEGDRKRFVPNNDEDSIDDPAENDEEDVDADTDAYADADADADADAEDN